MKIIDKIYINGQFVAPHGSEISDLINPTVNQVIGHVTLGDEVDTRMAIACEPPIYEFHESSPKHTCYCVVVIIMTQQATVMVQPEMEEVPVRVSDKVMRHLTPSRDCTG